MLQDGILQLHSCRSRGLSAEAETEVKVATGAKDDDEVKQHAEDRKTSKGKEQGEQGEQGTSNDGDELPESGASPVARGAMATEQLG